MMKSEKFKKPDSKLIHGLMVHPLKVIPDERGRVMEIMRRDDPFFSGFGQVYVTTVYPGIVKAWHFHKIQEDRFTCIRGMVKAVFYDERGDSPTRGYINEIYVGEHNPCLIIIPSGIYHGWKCIGDCEAYVINIPSEPYNRSDPDEYRVAPHSGKIPYDWTTRDG
jgi:dTDP-4-dehydrorhamnose 3,5-epimerase